MSSNYSDECSLPRSHVQFGNKRRKMHNRSPAKHLDVSPIRLPRREIPSRNVGGGKRQRINLSPERRPRTILTANYSPSGPSPLGFPPLEVSLVPPSPEKAVITNTWIPTPCKTDFEASAQSVLRNDAPATQGVNNNDGDTEELPAKYVSMLEDSEIWSKADGKCRQQLKKEKLSKHTTFQIGQPEVSDVCMGSGSITNTSTVAAGILANLQETMETQPKDQSPMNVFVSPCFPQKTPTSHLMSPSCLSRSRRMHGSPNKITNTGSPVRIAAMLNSASKPGAHSPLALQSPFKASTPSVLPIPSTTYSDRMFFSPIAAAGSPCPSPYDGLDPSMSHDYTELQCDSNLSMATAISDFGLPQSAEADADLTLAFEAAGAENTVWDADYHQATSPVKLAQPMSVMGALVEASKDTTVPKSDALHGGQSLQASVHDRQDSIHDEETDAIEVQISEAVVALGEINQTESEQRQAAISVETQSVCDHELQPALDEGGALARRDGGGSKQVPEPVQGSLPSMDLPAKQNVMALEQETRPQRATKSRFTARQNAASTRTLRGKRNKPTVAEAEPQVEELPSHIVQPEKFPYNSGEPPRRSRRRGLKDEASSQEGPVAPPQRTRSRKKALPASHAVDRQAPVETETVLETKPQTRSRAGKTTAIESARLDSIEPEEAPKRSRGRPKMGASSQGKTAKSGKPASSKRENPPPLTRKAEPAPAAPPQPVRRSTRVTRSRK